MATISSIYADSLLSLLHKVKINQIKMLAARGYNVSDEIALLTSNVFEFKIAYTQIAQQNNYPFRVSLSNSYVNDENKLIYVYYPNQSDSSKQLGINNITDLINLLQKNGQIKNVIIISENNLSSGAKEALDKLSIYRIETFLYDDLSHNPVEHYLVPYHELLNDEQASTYLNKNKIRFNQLPEISLYDPIIRYYGGIVGQIVRIHRINISYDGLVKKIIVHRGIVDKPNEKSK